MQQQTVLITGANKGIGLEAARQLAQTGYHVFLGSRDAAKGQLAAEQLKTAGLTEVEPIVIDVTNDASVAEARRQVGEKTGSLDVLINNAGISAGVQLPSAVSEEVMKRVFETNLFGPIRVIRHFMDLLRKAALPRIINVTSDLASLALHADPTWVYYPFKGPVYGPSKTALNAYTVALAFELRDTPFKVNMVNPGYTATDLNQHRGTKKVEEAARIIVQTAMADASGPTGKFLSDYGETPW